MLFHSRCYSTPASHDGKLQPSFNTVGLWLKESSQQYFAGVAPHQADLSSFFSSFIQLLLVILCLDDHHLSEVFHVGAILSGCSFIRLLFHEGGLSSGCSFMRVVFHQAALS